MSKIAIVYRSEKYSYHMNFVKNIKKVLEEIGHEALLLDTSNNKKKEMYLEVKKDEADFLITLDLEGFGWGTESGSIFYNLLSCKSLHFLFGDKEEYAEYLSNKLSIAMFFYCVGEKENVIEGMIQKYPNISYIKGVTGMEEPDVKAVLKDIRDEIEMQWK